MEARLLGSISIGDGPNEVSLTSGRQRDLLAALLCHVNKPVPSAQLADILWDEDPPPNARAAVRTYVMRLRQSLGPSLGIRIVTRPQGYLFTADEAEVDLLRFDQHYRRARTAIREGKWRDAAGELQMALALWRGHPLADVGSQLLREKEAPRLEQLYLQSLEWYYEAQLVLGRHQDIVLDLRHTVDAYPLRERFCAQLMLALYRSGHRSDGLAAYRVARRQLVDELGIEPSQDLQRIHQMILDDVGDVAPQSADATGVSGEQLVPIVPRQLPPTSRHFTGRNLDQHALYQTLGDARSNTTKAAIVTVVGIGGIGKTALAVHWAHRVADLFPDGQLFVSLRGFETVGCPTSPQAALRSLLDAFEIRGDRIPATFEAQCALYRSIVADKRALIVLDNARDEEQVRDLLPGGQGCMTIITSRNRLAGLLVDSGCRSIQLRPLPADETLALIERFLGRERLADDPDAAERMVEMSGRIPLTASILASEALVQAELTIRQVLSSFDHIPSRLDRFETGDTTTSIRSLLGSSYRNLTPRAQRLFRMLGLHWGDRVSLPAARSLAAMTIADARQAFAELARHHLVERERHGQFVTHDLVRDFAVEQVHCEERPSDRRAAKARLLDYYLRSLHRAAHQLEPARHLNSLPPRQPEAAVEEFGSVGQAVDWFEANRDAILSALAHAHDEGFSQYVWLMTERVSTFLERLGHWHDWDRAACCALKATRGGGNLLARAVAELERGSALDRITPDQDLALAHLTRALELFERLGDVAGLARTQMRLLLFHGWRNREDVCRRHAERALDLYQILADRGGQARALNALGWFCVSFGDCATAVSSCRTALDLYQDCGDRAGEADTWDSLAFAYHASGDAQAADVCYRRAIYLDEVLDRIGHRFNQADTQNRYGDLLFEVGDHEAALLFWQKALSTLDDLNHPEGAAVRQKIREHRLV